MDSPGVGEDERKKGREERLERRIERHVVCLAVAAAGHGGRVQRRAVRMLNDARAAGPWELWFYIKRLDFLKAKRPGRPRKKLW